MNSYQHNAIGFFMDRRSQFLDWLMSKSSTTIVSIDDMAEEVLVFLEKEIRHDLSYYQPGCNRYNVLLDMLIELHVSRQDDIFRKNLRASGSDYLITGSA